MIYCLFIFINEYLFIPWILTRRKKAKHMKIVHKENISDEKVIKVVEKYDHIILDCNKVINYMVILEDYLFCFGGVNGLYSQF